MPRVRLMAPDGFNWEIDTRSPELLEQWFDEILPWAYMAGRPGIDDFETIWPRVNVSPMWAWQPGAPTDPDWLCDSRVLGLMEELRAKNGAEGMSELARIRREAERELDIAAGRDHEER